MTDELDDVEIGRYALRTFRVDRRNRALLPVMLTMGHQNAARADWAGGQCIARCRSGRTHRVPADDCRCGIYGATDLVSLLEQYPVLARNIVAVIAAEGDTIVGSRGLRTQAARVVAYWCRPGRDSAREILAEQCQGAEEFADQDEMLRAFGLRATAVPEQPLAAAAGLVSGIGRMVDKLRAQATFVTTGRQAVLAWLLWACVRVSLAPALLAIGLALMAVSSRVPLAPGRWAESSPLARAVVEFVRSGDTVMSMWLSTHTPSVVVFGSLFLMFSLTRMLLRRRLALGREVLVSALAMSSTALVRVYVFFAAYALTAGLPISLGLMAAPVVFIAVWAGLRWPAR